MEEDCIYKIVVGTDPHSQIRFTVGQTVRFKDEAAGVERSLKISEIIEDKNNFYYFGAVKYTIYVINEKEVVCKYRDFTGPIPIQITYNVPR